MGQPDIQVMAPGRVENTKETVETAAEDAGPCFSDIALIY
jgi:hypothetical protein